MSTAVKVAVCCVLVLSLWCVSGCAKKADTNKPISQINAEAGKMTVEQLRQKAKSCQEALAAKKVDLEKLTAKLKGIPVTEMVGENAKKLHTDIANISKDMSALKDQFEVYYQKLKEKGGDASGLQI